MVIITLYIDWLASKLRHIVFSVDFLGLSAEQA